MVKMERNQLTNQSQNKKNIKENTTTTTKMQIIWSFIQEHLMEMRMGKRVEMTSHRTFDIDEIYKICIHLQNSYL